MSDRELVLSRIRAAQAKAHSEGPHAPVDSPDQTFGQVMPQVGADYTAMRARFAEQCAKLKVRLIEVADAAGAEAAVGALALELGWRRVAVQEGFEPVVGGLDVLKVEAGYDRWELEKCDAGVTGCVCLVAQTGSVVVTARQTGGRALSVLPPHHVVVARREQMVADMVGAYAALERELAERPSSFASFITGPSRTGDIERILVLGAHGPKWLTVVVVG